MYRRKIGVVFQAYNLFPHLSALENVMLPLQHVHHRPDAEQRAQAALEQMHLDVHLKKSPPNSAAVSVNGWPSRGRWRSNRSFF